MSRRSKCAKLISCLIAAAAIPGLVPTLYAQEESTSIGGYGEVHYVDVEGSPRGTVDVPRFIIFLEHSFNADISFMSELEVEHTKLEGGEEGGEVALEQAYINYKLSDRTTLRGGLMLIPMGIINETHEPPTFNGVTRPAFDRVILPTTWREIGVGVNGTIPGMEEIRYRLLATSGLNSDNFSPSNGIRGGRYEGAVAPMNNLALSGKVEYVEEGYRIGAWGYYGGSSNNNVELGTGLFDAGVSIVGLDARASIGDLDLRGVFAAIDISAADTINGIRRRDTLGAPIGSGIGGGYIEAAYNIMSLVDSESGARLMPFVRYEAFNTQSSMPAGYSASDANKRAIITTGLTFKPTYNTAFKIDWAINDDGTDADRPGVFSMGLGWYF